MSWRLVARQGVREAWRSWEFRGTLLSFSLLFAMIGYVAGPSAFGSGNDASAFFGFVTGVMVVLIPATAVVLSHDDVAGRREDGRLRLLFGQPISRRSLVIGQYAAAGVVIVVSVVVAVAIGLLVASLRSGTFVPAKMAAAILGVGILLGLTHLGIGISISTALKTTNFSGALAFGAFLVFSLAWSVVPRGVLWLVNKVVAVELNPWWLVYVDLLSPITATGQLLAPGVALGGLANANDAPVYLFAGIVLVWWIVGLPALAIRRFEGTDL